MAKRIVQPIGLFSYFQILGVSVAPMLPADLCHSFSTVSRDEAQEMKRILFLQNCAKIHLQQCRISKHFGNDPLVPALKGNGGGVKEGERGEEGGERSG